MEKHPATWHLDLPTTGKSSVDEADCCRQQAMEVTMPALEHCMAFQL